jgi:peroxiredoxin
MVTFRRLAVFLCLLSMCFAQHTPRKCADIPLRTTDGKTIRVSQYRGKVVMFTLFLTSCEECLAELEFMRRLQNEYGSRGLQVIGISLDESAALVGLFQQRYRFPFPLSHLDRDPAITLTDLSKTGHPVVPYLMFVDWKGSVRFQYPANDPIFNQGEKGIRTIADGLLREAAEKRDPVYKTAPAGKQ